MRLVLVNPPIHCLDFDQVHPPLGLLCLAEEAIMHGHSVKLLDLNLKSCEGRLDRVANTYEVLAQQIVETEPNAVGLTSMGLNSHASLLLARELKRKMPNIVILLGGPHFSAAPESFLREYAFVDGIVAGTAEGVFPTALDELGMNGGERRVFRAAKSEGSHVSSRGRPPSHPWHAYSLLNLEDYYALQRTPRLCYETSRGCIYNCHFCYSKLHFGNPSLDATPDQVVEDFNEFRRRGCRSIFIVGDNLLNVPNSAEQMCHALREARTGVEWSCYATLPQITHPLIRCMAEAGCTNMFLGIDAVTSGQERAFGKGFLRSPSDLCENVRRWRDCGLRPTLAFVVDIVRDNDRTLHEVLHLAAKLRLAGGGIRINCLCLYTGTAIARHNNNTQASYSESRIRILQDCHDMVVRNPLAEVRLDLFPFHRRDLEEAEWERRLRALHAAQVIVRRYPRTCVRMASRGHNLWQVAEHVVDGIDRGLWMDQPRSRKKIVRLTFARLADSELLDIQATKGAYHESEAF